MRYWHPLIEDVIPQIYNDGVRKLIGLSLYPQYCLATSGSSLSKFREVASKYSMEVFCTPSWYDHPLYIKALVDVIKNGIESFNSNYSKLRTLNLMSMSSSAPTAFLKNLLMRATLMCVILRERLKRL